MPFRQSTAAAEVVISPLSFIHSDHGVTLQTHEDGSVVQGRKDDGVPPDLKKKFNAILSHEQSRARSVAAAVIRPKPLSVWEVLIPIIFIPWFVEIPAFFMDYGGTMYASKSPNGNGEPPTGKCTEYPASDANKDCKVNLLDIAILSLEWLKCNLEPVEACN